MDRCTQAIGDILPTWHPSLCRPPYGDLSFGFLRYAIKRRLRIVLWTKDSLDYRPHSVDFIYSPSGDKARPWKGPYHNGRAMIRCLELLESDFKA